MIELKITLNDNGQCSVHGPIHDKVLSYGLLEFAKDIIRSYDPKQKIIKPLPGAQIPGSKKQGVN